MATLPLLFLSILALSLSSCALLQEMQGPQLTPLEIQSLQTREYKAPKELVFASVMSVFQNLGYNIVSADQATGFISAKSLLQSDTQFTGTAFVETIGGMTRVRLSFVKKASGSRWDSGTMMHHHKDGHLEKYKDEKQVLDAALYQNAFEQIDSELFVRSSH
ncbi:MAG: hypothetical protein K2W97_08945 [Chthoniobacterales bacterium]|nr:hypothetical protein [Chthoniobacterales bacterium]